MPFNHKKLYFFNILSWVFLKLVFLEGNLSTSRQIDTDLSLDVTAVLDRTAQQQTIILFNKTELNLIDQPQIKLTDSSQLFSIEQVDDLVYLTFSPGRLQRDNYVLDLGPLNVNFKLITNEPQSKPTNSSGSKYHVQYILKVFNDSDYGLIKNDLSIVVLAVVKLFHQNSVNLVVNKRVLDGKYFEIKSLSTNHYMIKLVNNRARELIQTRKDHQVVLRLETNIPDLVIDLKFKIVDKEQLSIKLLGPTELDIIREPNIESNTRYLLHKIESELQSDIFFSIVDEMKKYKSQFIRYSTQSDLVEIDPITGAVICSNSRELFSRQRVLVNVSVYDVNKIFSGARLLLHLNIKERESHSVVRINQKVLDKLLFVDNKYLVVNKTGLKRRVSHFESQFTIDESGLWMSADIFQFLKQRIEFVSVDNFILEIENTNSLVVSKQSIKPIQFYKFRVDENVFNVSLGSIQIDAAKIDSNSSLRLESSNQFYSNHLNVSSLGQQSYQVFVSQPFDYESQKQVDFFLTTVDKFNTTAKIQIQVIVVDQNDNKPKFINPSETNETISVKVKDVFDHRVLVTQIEAHDSDLSSKFSKIKYVLVDVPNKQLENEYLSLNDLTGCLYLHIRQTHDLARKEYEFSVKVRAYNYLDLSEPNYSTIQFKVRVIFDFNLIMFRNLPPNVQQNNLIKLSLQEDERIEQCWRNNQPVESSHMLFSNHNRSEAFIRTDFDEAASVYCRLDSGKWINYESVDPNKVDSRNDENDDLITVSFDQDVFLSQKYPFKVYDAKELADPGSLNRRIVTFELDNHNKPQFLNSIFELNRVSGLLRTVPSRLVAYKQLLAQVTQINLRFSIIEMDITTYKPVRQSNHILNIVLVNNNKTSHPSLITKIFYDLTNSVIAPLDAQSTKNQGIKWIGNTTIQPSGLVYIDSSSLCMNFSLITHYESRMFMVELNDRPLTVMVKFQLAGSKFIRSIFKYSFYKEPHSNRLIDPDGLNTFDTSKPMIDLKSLVQFYSSQLTFQISTGDLFLDKANGLLFAPLNATETYSFDISLINSTTSRVISTAKFLVTFLLWPTQISKPVQSLFQDSVTIKLSQMKEMIKNQSDWNQREENLLTKLNQVEGYELVVYQFDKNRFESDCQVEEFAIVYDQNDQIPFEIDRFSGSVYYLISEDLDWMFHDKSFNLSITLECDRSKSKHFLLKVEFINDDPIYLIDSQPPIQYFYYMDRLNNQIGQIATRYDNQSDKSLYFELVNKSLLIDVNYHTGYMITTGLESDAQFEVQITGFVGHRPVLIRSEVHITTVKRSPQRWFFQKDVFDIIITMSSNASSVAVQLSSLAGPTPSVTFNLIANPLEGSCELNRTGVLECNFINSIALQKDIEFVAQACYIGPRCLQTSQLAVVNFIVVEAEITKSAPIQITDQILKHHIQGLESFNVFLLLKEKFADPSSFRVYFNNTGHLNDSKEELVSSYYDLDSVNGQLTPKQNIKNQLGSMKHVISKLSLKQMFRLVSIGVDLITKSSLSLELDIMLSSNSEYSELIQPLFFKVQYEDLMEKSSKSLFKFGNVSPKPTSKYFLETINTNAVKTPNYDLVITSSISLTNDFSSLLCIDVKNGDLYLNRSSFLTNKMSQINFHLLEYDEVNSLLISRIKSKLDLVFQKRTNYLDYYLNVQRNVIFVDQSIPVNKTGPILNLNRIIPFHDTRYESWYLECENDQELDELPFRIHPPSGDLIIVNEISDSRVYAFDLKSREFNLVVHFRLGTNIQRFSLPSTIDLSVSIQNFNKKIPLCKLSSYSNGTRLLYHLASNNSVDSSDGSDLISSIISMLHLNELDGLIEVRDEARASFVKLCQAWTNNPSFTFIPLIIKAYNQFNDLEYSMILVRIQPACDSKTLSSAVFKYEQLQFEDSYYFIKRSSDNTNYLARVALKQHDFLVFDLNFTVSYYFCSSQTGISNYSDYLSTLIIDEKTGIVKLNPSIQLTEARYEYKVCAILTDSLIEKTFLVETQLFVINQNNHRSESSQIVLDVPYHPSVGFSKLIKLNKKNLKEDYFLNNKLYFNHSNSWVYLNTEGLSLNETIKVTELDLKLVVKPVQLIHVKLANNSESSLIGNLSEYFMPYTIQSLAIQPEDSMLVIQNEQLYARNVIFQDGHAGYRFKLVIGDLCLALVHIEFKGFFKHQNNATILNTKRRLFNSRHLQLNFTLSELPKDNRILFDLKQYVNKRGRQVRFRLESNDTDLLQLVSSSKLAFSPSFFNTRFFFSFTYSARVYVLNSTEEPIFLQVRVIHSFYNLSRVCLKEFYTFSRELGRRQLKLRRFQGLLDYSRYGTSSADFKINPTNGLVTSRNEHDYYLLYDNMLVVNLKPMRQLEMNMIKDGNQSIVNHQDMRNFDNVTTEKIVDTVTTRPVVDTDRGANSSAESDYLYFNISVLALFISLFSLLIFILILATIYIRTRSNQLAKKADNKFNSKNRLELSLNNSSLEPNNASSPLPSSRSSILINQQLTKQDALTAEFILNCSNLIVSQPADMMPYRTTMPSTAENYVEIAGDVNSSLVDSACLDYEQMRDFLKWTPTFNEYENLFYEFGTVFDLNNPAKSTEKNKLEPEIQTYV